jgi:hypothetical protein
MLDVVILHRAYATRRVLSIHWTCTRVLSVQRNQALEGPRQALALLTLSTTYAL